MVRHWPASHHITGWFLQKFGRAEGNVNAV